MYQGAYQRLAEKKQTAAKGDEKGSDKIMSMVGGSSPTVATAAPVSKGTVLSMYVQDPTVNYPSQIVKTVYVPDDVKDGPSDAQISVHTKCNNNDVVAKRNKILDFVVDPKIDPKLTETYLDLVHTYTVVRLVTTMYERAVRSITGDAKFQIDWQWNRGQPESKKIPINVDPQAGVEENAYYYREGKELKFFRFSYKSDPCYTCNVCRSFDVVAHETGHAILDALRPEYFDAPLDETLGLHEAFGDITCMCALLYQLDVCENIIVATKMNLRQNSFLSVLAEQFGEAETGQKVGLRNANNMLKISDVSGECHDLSQVFSGMIYHVIVDLFEALNNPKLEDPAQTLHKVGMIVSGVLVQAIICSTNMKQPTYGNIAFVMTKIADEAQKIGHISKNIHDILISSIEAQCKYRMISVNDKQLSVTSMVKATSMLSSEKLHAAMADVNRRWSSNRNTLFSSSATALSSSSSSSASTAVLSSSSDASASTMASAQSSTDAAVKAGTNITCSCVAASAQSSTDAAVKATTSKHKPYVLKRDSSDTSASTTAPAHDSKDAVRETATSTAPGLSGTH